MAGWHHRLDGRESQWTPGVGDGQGGLVCCDSWGRKESDTTEQLNWTELIVLWCRVSHRTVYCSGYSNAYCKSQFNMHKMGQTNYCSCTNLLLLLILSHLIVFTLLHTLKPNIIFTHSHFPHPWLPSLVHTNWKTSFQSFPQPSENCRTKFYRLLNEHHLCPLIGLQSPSLLKSVFHTASRIGVLQYRCENVILLQKTVNGSNVIKSNIFHILAPIYLSGSFFFNSPLPPKTHTHVCMYTYTHTPRSNHIGLFVSHTSASCLWKYFSLALSSVVPTSHMWLESTGKMLSQN